MGKPLDSPPRPFTPGAFRRPNECSPSSCSASGTPAKSARAPRATALPAAHVRIGQLRAIAVGEVKAVELECAHRWGIHHPRRASCFVADPLQCHLPDVSNSNGEIVDVFDGDL